MADYTVIVTIENKPGISDPEGSTILKDLVLKGSFGSVSDIRAAKMLKFTIAAQTAQQAEETVRKICDEMRIYNPVSSKITVQAD